MSPVKVAVVSTVHRRDDVRAFAKVASTLARQPFLEVVAVVADGAGSDGSGTYPVVDVGRSPGGRMGRAVIGGWRMVRYLTKNRPDVVHVHSPEFLPYALLLSLRKTEIVYDVHEDLGKDIQDKYYLPRYIRAFVAGVAVAVQRLVASRASLIVAATESIAAPFASSRTIVVHNYPLLGEFPELRESRDAVGAGEGAGDGDEVPEFVYLGALTEIRGLTQVVDALEHVQDDAPVTLRIAGPASPPEYLISLSARAGWEHVSYTPMISRAQIPDFLRHARAGIVTFLPEKNHLEAQPNKMFEYMAAGLPLIASDFPAWRRLLEQSGAAIFVDPEDPEDIARAFRLLADNAFMAREMGRRGRMATRTLWNWEADSRVLVEAYKAL